MCGTRRFRFVWPTLIAAVVLLVPAMVSAQGGGGGASNAGTQAPACPAPAAKVTDAYLYENPDRARDTSRTVRLRETIAVRLDHLDYLTQQLKCLEATDTKKHTVVLFLDDRPLPDLTPYPPTDPQANVLLFSLTRTESSRDVWKHVLGKPGLSTRRIRVSVGPIDGFPLASTAEVQFTTLPRRWFIAWGIIFIALLVAFFRLAAKSDILRDTTPEPPRPGKRRAFSLALVQASWWFFIILGSYLLIGMVTGDYSTSITGSVLVLLGISVGTTAGAVLVEKGRGADPADAAALRAKVTVKEAELAKALADETAMREAIARLSDQAGLSQADRDALNAANRDLPAAHARRQSLDEEVMALRNESSNFFIDIMSDANRVSLHRFQLVAWSVVLGIVFGVEVYRELAMPQFNATLLGLLGISSGTYVGLKTQEARPNP
ncbi:MAG: hypothetical protein HY700_11635 [Gemmatimonadetes bacterium]|nr:hypothetical protein [Gemmatimonadota bacterium]